MTVTMVVSGIQESSNKFMAIQMTTLNDYEWLLSRFLFNVRRRRISLYSQCKAPSA